MKEGKKKKTKRKATYHIFLEFHPLESFNSSSENGKGKEYVLLMSSFLALYKYIYR